MASVPARVSARIKAGLKKYQPILEDARKRNVSESNTVTIVTDILSDIFGYDKFREITSEHAIRSTFCDLAVKLAGKLAILIEVKAVGRDLKDNHIRQAVDYAANEGCDWVALTNGMNWQVYQMSFGKPIGSDLVLDLDLLALSHHKADDAQLLAILSREAWKKSRLDDYATQKHALSRFTIAAVLLAKPVLQAVRRELRHISAPVKVGLAEIEKVLTQEVIKREVIEGDKADVARKLVSKAARKQVSKTAKRAPRSADKGNSVTPGKEGRAGSLSGDAPP